MESFNDLFNELSGNYPFPWQKNLYESFCNNSIPDQCDIPTGLGKTMVIPIWLLAMINNPGVLPRRLVYVVDRRTVVDQATDVIMDILIKIQTSPNLQFVKNKLEELSALPVIEGNYLAVSTLRGELADNELWKNDPTRPSVIIGTVDMIGSKLLFSGYGDSRRLKPLHAGFLGCDTLVINDEAHLTPAFGKLMRSIIVFQKQKRNKADLEIALNLKFMELSATQIPESSNLEKLELSPADRSHSVIEKRIKAKKTLYFHEIQKDGEITEKIVSTASESFSEVKRVIIYVQSPETAQKIVTELHKSLKKYLMETWEKQNPDIKPGNNIKAEFTRNAEERISILTGRIRGYERDLLMEKKGMQPFLENESYSESIFLVSTSAGEVGINLHADAMISDLTPLDSMIQRLGRINRFGENIDSAVDIFFTKANVNKNDPVSFTYKLLKHGNVEEGFSIDSDFLLSLSQDKDYINAFRSVEETMELSDTLLDLWSMTSLYDIPARPKPESWLHGCQTNIPQTNLIWREEVEHFKDVDVNDIKSWFVANPITSKEKISLPTFLFTKLNSKTKQSAFLEKEIAEDLRSGLIVLIDKNREPHKIIISELIKNPTHYDLAYGTLIFPTSINGVNHNGFLDFKKGNSKKLDVSLSKSAKIIIHRTDDLWSYSLIYKMGESVLGNKWISLKKAISLIEKELKLKCKIKFQTQFTNREFSENDSINDRWLLLLTPLSHIDKGIEYYPSVKTHCEDVMNILDKFCNTLILPKYIAEAIVLAGKYHDAGKNSEIWQRSIGKDFNQDTALAKGSVNWRVLDGFRHELESVIDITNEDEIKNHPEKDLIFHLVSSHHGWARPYFKNNAFPKDFTESESEDVNMAVMERFNLLQRRFGWWKLAFLESLLRRADGIASANHDREEF